MDKDFTHQKCSITVRQSEDREFEFIVPQHSVDKEGNIDKDILQEIKDKFELGELDFGDCDEGTYPSFGYAETYVPPTSKTTIEGGCSFTDELPVFGENK